jgi:hypothetical protein
VQNPHVCEIERQHLTDILAEQVMGWTICPKRFSFGQRGWMPRWRFQPTQNIADAFQLLENTDVVEYVLHVDRKGSYRAKVLTPRSSAEATSSSLPFAICVAVAHAYGISVGAGK